MCGVVVWCSSGDCGLEWVVRVVGVVGVVVGGPGVVGEWVGLVV